jgi:HlyD family secretion protein
VVKRSSLTALALVALTLAAAGTWLRPQARAAERAAPDAGSAVAARTDFVRSVRLAGTVEAVQATTIAAPRLSGQNQNSLVIMRMIKAGTTVKAGDALIEFDRQEQLRNALDRKAELNDFEQQIKRRMADEVAARASDDSTLMQAGSTLEKARLELVKNEMLPKLQAEKNNLAFE